MKLRDAEKQRKELVIALHAIQFPLRNVSPVETLFCREAEIDLPRAKSRRNHQTAPAMKPDEIHQQASSIHSPVDLAA